MAHNNSSEYQQVLRINATPSYDIYRAPGHVFVSNQKPTAAQQYVRDMTLACGRILYEVWDHWNERILGYVCPEEILNEAKAYRPDSVLNGWPEEPEDRRRALERSYERVRMMFPRTPHVACKAVAEEVQRRFRQTQVRKRDVEQLVVEYVREKWTSWEFRVYFVKQSRAEVEELVLPRIREVLTSWMDEYERRDKVVGVWERQGLLDARVHEVEADLPRDAMTWYGGKELPGNIRSLPGGLESPSESVPAPSKHLLAAWSFHH